MDARNLIELQSSGWLFQHLRNIFFLFEMMVMMMMMMMIPIDIFGRDPNQSLLRTSDKLVGLL